MDLSGGGDKDVLCIRIIIIILKIIKQYPLFQFKGPEELLICK